MRRSIALVVAATSVAAAVGGYVAGSRNNGPRSLPSVPAHVERAARGSIPPEPPVLRPFGSAPESVRLPEGAGRFAARAVERLGSRELLAEPDSAKAVLAELGGPGLARELGPRYATAFSAMAAALPVSPERRVLRAGALGYRVEGWSNRAAVIAVWKVTLVGTAARGVVANWDTSHVRLVWRSGRWWVDSFGPDTPGPAPGAARVGAETPPAAFAADEADFRRLG